MATEYGSTRWWENYAVRYLMPSIAGIVIVNWLCKNGNADLRSLLSLPAASERIDTASLTLLFLYGNLFCYIASYPVLVFHATRVLDFKKEQYWPAFPWSDGYITTIVLILLAFVSVHHYPANHYVSFFLISMFVIVQLIRLSIAFWRRVDVDGCNGKVSPLYGYSYALARRRGRVKTKETKGGKSTSADFDDNDETKVTQEIVWYQDYMETYRHLREHGNSAFIFLQELALAALIYPLIAKSNQSASQQLGLIAVLLAIWAIPAVFVHLVGQHLERRFSHYDRRLGKI